MIEEGRGEEGKMDRREDRKGRKRRLITSIAEDAQS